MSKKRLSYEDTGVSIDRADSAKKEMARSLTTSHPLAFAKRSPSGD